MWWIIGGGWIALSCISALSLGRAIRIADEKESTADV
jgi:hypothetical protein